MVVESPNLAYHFLAKDFTGDQIRYQVKQFKDGSHLGSDFVKVGALDS